MEEALKQLRSFTYRRRRLISTAKPSQRRARSPFTPHTALAVVRSVAHLRPEERDKSLDDPGARSGAIHIFKHLKHHGYSWEPEYIHAWATTNGFPAQDARLLAEYAEGVKSGTRYHTAPDPFGRHAISYWRENAQPSRNGEIFRDQR